MYTEIVWDDTVKIGVGYVTEKDLDEPRGWAVNAWWIGYLVIGDTRYTDSYLFQYLYDTMSDKHRDYIQTACEEDRAVHLDQQGS